MSAIDHWDLIRGALGLALILCNIGVWRGVALEESNDKFDKEIGKTLLIRSLALEALFAAALFIADTYASMQQKYEIAQLNAQIAPRRLTIVQQANITRALTPFAGKSIIIGSYILDVESAVLGGQITEVVKKAKFSTNSE